MKQAISYALALWILFDSAVLAVIAIAMIFQ
jgi:hypothetical protein